MNYVDFNFSLKCVEIRRKGRRWKDVKLNSRIMWKENALCLIPYCESLCPSSAALRTQGTWYDMIWYDICKSCEIISVRLFACCDRRPQGFLVYSWSKTTSIYHTEKCSQRNKLSSIVFSLLRWRHSYMVKLVPSITANEWGEDKLYGGINLFLILWFLVM